MTTGKKTVLTVGGKKTFWQTFSHIFPQNIKIIHTNISKFKKWMAEIVSLKQKQIFKREILKLDEVYSNFIAIGLFQLEKPWFILHIRATRRTAETEMQL